LKSLCYDSQSEKHQITNDVMFSENWLVGQTR